MFWGLLISFLFCVSFFHFWNMNHFFQPTFFEILIIYGHVSLRFVVSFFACNCVLLNKLVAEKFKSWTTLMGIKKTHQQLVFYNNLKLYSYLHNNYVTNQQAMNFITILSWKMDDTFEMSTKHDMLQNIVHVFIGHPLPLLT